MRKIWSKLLSGVLALSLCLGMMGTIALATDNIENTDNIEETYESTVKQGIDVSHHQGAINWAKVKAAGIDFAIIRCGYGDDLENQDDRYWEANIRGCEENDIPYGIYLYSYATSEQAVASEVQHTLRLIKEVGATPSYPIYYDLEDDTVLACGREAIIRMANQYCSAIEAAGYDAGIYASKHWWDNYLNDASLEQYDKWIAQWAEECTYEGYYRLWQYTSDGSIDGIAGHVDMNYKIQRIDLSDAIVTVEGLSTYPYDGQEKKPTVTSVTLADGTVLTEGVDYIVAYNNNIYPGTGQVKVVGRGIYEGVVRSKFTILPPTVAGQSSVTANLYGADDIEIRWSGQNIPNATVKYKVEYQKQGGAWTLLASGITGTSYKKANLQAGARYAFRVTPYVTLGGKNYYGLSKTSGSVYTLAKMKMNSVKKSSKTKIALKWKDIQGESGYEIARSTKKSKGYKVVKTTKVNAKSIKIKTTRGKTFYYKVRAYKKVNGKKIYGQWSAPKKYKLK